MIVNQVDFTGSKLYVLMNHNEYIVISPQAVFINFSDNQLTQIIN